LGFKQVKMNNQLEILTNETKMINLEFTQMKIKGQTWDLYKKKKTKRINLGSTSIKNND
jgi:hypothetical protein